MSKIKGYKKAGKSLWIKGLGRKKARKKDKNEMSNMYNFV